MNTSIKHNTKIKLLEEFFKKHQHLPEQNTKQWLEDRKYFIGGSEMSTIVGKNPYKNIRGLIENHLGLDPFQGNVNTYWGSVLEDYTVLILEIYWKCKIRETGSLPGAIYEQKYSPDGLVYVDFLDQIILLEIKNAIRRVANGRVPSNYKPQIYTGLATIPIADRALFIDSMFRRCCINNFDFTKKYDTVLHPKKPVDTPLLLGAVFVYEKIYSGDYDKLKNKYGKDKDSFIDAGICSSEDLSEILKNIRCKKLVRVFSSVFEEQDTDYTYKQDLINEFNNVAKGNDYTPICILPLKLFKFETILVERDDWKKKYNKKLKLYEKQDTTYKNYVEQHADTIRRVINQIKELDGLSHDDIRDRLDEMYPPSYKLPSDEFCDSLFKSAYNIKT